MTPSGVNIQAPKSHTTIQLLSSSFHQLSRWEDLTGLINSDVCPNAVNILQEHKSDLSKNPHFWVWALGDPQNGGGYFYQSDSSKHSVFQLEVKDVLGTVLKRRLIFFVPLQEPEPLQNGDRAPCCTPVTPEAPVAAGASG